MTAGFASYPSLADRSMRITPVSSGIRGTGHDVIVDGGRA